MTSFSPFLNRDYPAGDAPFNPAIQAGPQPYFRDVLDERRTMWRQTPEAQYPDGYLGTLNSRREDRLLATLTARANQRPFARGVHKGERMDPSDYFWPPEFNMMTGLELEAIGEKFTPPGLGAEWTGIPLSDQLALSTIGPRGIPRAKTQVSPPWSGPPTVAPPITAFPRW